MTAKPLPLAEAIRLRTARLSSMSLGEGGRSRTWGEGVDPFRGYRRTLQGPPTGSLGSVPRGTREQLALPSTLQLFSGERRGGERGSLADQQHEQAWANLQVGSLLCAQGMFVV